jgi:serine/threonine-protein kinase
VPPVVVYGDSHAPVARRRLILLVSSLAIVAGVVVWAVAHKRAQNGGEAVAQTAVLAPPVLIATSPPEPLPAQTPAIPDATNEAPPPAASVPPAAVRQAPAAASRKPPPTAARNARLAFAVTPWGEVYVDGRRRGVSPPLKELKLAPGKHTVEIRNTNFKRHTQTVELVADASVRIKYKFQ